VDALKYLEKLFVEAIVIFLGELFESQKADEFGKDCEVVRELVGRVHLLLIATTYVRSIKTRLPISYEKVMQNMRCFWQIT